MTGHQYEVSPRMQGSWSGSLRRSFGRWLDQVRERRRARREIASLRDWSDRLLDDIGLTRAELSRDRDLARATESRQGSAI